MVQRRWVQRAPTFSPIAAHLLRWAYRKRYCLTRADSPHQSLQISNRSKSLGLQMANPRGQQRDKPFRDALRMEIAAAGEDHKALREVARALLTKAASGDVHAIREVGDRLDGKVGAAALVGMTDRRRLRSNYRDRRAAGRGLPRPQSHSASSATKTPRPASHRLPSSLLPQPVATIFPPHQSGSVLIRPYLLGRYN
jgi:hypothetical protein